MIDREALALLRRAIPDPDGQVWADLGCGSGVFTQALAALVGPAGHVYAVDADTRSLDTVRAWAAAQGEATASISAVQADITRPLSLPPLDGALMANVLHFIAVAGAVLAHVAARLKPGGRLVVIEYQDRHDRRWVPYPLPAERLAELAAPAGFDVPTVAATRPSAFGGSLYVATARRIPG